MINSQPFQVRKQRTLILVGSAASVLVEAKNAPEL
jgi:hypothetical protein